ncbi:uncharacterized protein LOC135709502 [Ochlerotatus camptorhynchus]|uniref:uncharacterized protein LOC135709502 n=1 Tax=Ochlerotatus camptorhynchus TaxID=644619 RepID=UPI0031D1EB11
MATDTDDQGFDEALKNFQLLTGLSPAPTVTVPAGNPFQIGPTALEAFRDNEAVVKQIFGTHCECGAERMLPTTSSCNSSAATVGKHNQPLGKHSTSLEHGIINPTPFKHKVKGEKKAIVRESMLKNIGKCVHQNLVKQNSIAKEAAKQQNSPNTFLPAAAPASQLKPSLSETNLTKCFNSDESGDILDFRLLVAQCSELTLSSSASTSKSSDGPNYSQSSFKSLRQPDFASFQLNRSTGSSTANSRRNRRARQLKRYNSTSSLESDSSSNSSVPFGIGPLGTAVSCTTGPSTSQSSQCQNPPQQQSPSASSPSSSASASCSTQARLNNVMPCDITIDEMASYFETLVHIPKKMSSMAEMMYI